MKYTLIIFAVFALILGAPDYSVAENILEVSQTEADRTPPPRDPPPCPRGDPACS